MIAPFRFGYVVFAGGLLSLSIAPAWVEPHEDAYPFSTYPMFTAHREAPSFAKVEGHLRTGAFEAIPPAYLGTDEVMQAVVTVRHAAKRKGRAMRLCRKVLKSAPKNRYRKVQIVRVKYDPIDYFVSGPTPLERKVIASCPEKNKKNKAKTSKRQGKKRP